MSTSYELFPFSDPANRDKVTSLDRRSSPKRVDLQDAMFSEVDDHLLGD